MKKTTDLCAYAPIFLYFIPFQAAFPSHIKKYLDEFDRTLLTLNLYQEYESQAQWHDHNARHSLCPSEVPLPDRPVLWVFKHVVIEEPWENIGHRGGAGGTNKS